MKLSEDGKELIEVTDDDIHSDGSFVIPKGVIAIRNFAFGYFCSRLKTLIIPIDVVSIGFQSFRHCSSLQSLTILSGATSTRYEAFKGCSQLQVLTIPAGVISIGERAFEGCSRLQTFIIPEKVASIGAYAFNGCIQLQTLTMQGDVISIGVGAFYGCSSLQTLTIPSTVNCIAPLMFKNCSGLQNLTILPGVVLIGDYAFSGCNQLQFFTFPEGVTSIGFRAFEGCSRLQILTLPTTVKFVGAEVFQGCSSLHSIVISGGDADEISRVTALLPLEFQNKVTTEALAQEAFDFMKAQLVKVAQTPQINSLYPLLSIDSRFVPQVKFHDEQGDNIKVACHKLPDDVFQHMNDFLTSSNPYYKKADQLMRAVPLPKNREDMRAYQLQVEGIAQTVINKAKNFKSFFLHPQFIQEQQKLSTNITPKSPPYILSKGCII